MIIKKEDKNTYQIKIYKYLDVYNIDILQSTIKDIIKKIKKKYYLRKEIVLDIYPSDYETIIILRDYNKLINTLNITDVKMNIHTNTARLYEIDYHFIKDIKGTTYYYNNKFYLKIENITKEDYLYLSENSKRIYTDTEKILEEGIKINI